jgi:hypothetical protein
VGIHRFGHVDEGGFGLGPSGGVHGLGELVVEAGQLVKVCGTYLAGEDGFDGGRVAPGGHGAHPCHAFLGLGTGHVQVRVLPVDQIPVPQIARQPTGFGHRKIRQLGRFLLPQRGFPRGDPIEQRLTT